MITLVGRKPEIEKFQTLMHSAKAAFVAVYGRRRVGKTHLVREFFKNKGLYFEIVGLKDGSLEEELSVFHQSFQQLFYPDIPLMPAKSWQEAFTLLTKEIRKSHSKKIILFFDELPWLATARSGFVEQLDHFWNSQWSQMKNLVLVVCGSAASWMLENLVYAKGGLHNRVTHTFNLLPFNLKETKDYLEFRGLHWSHRQILDLYMVTGGVPYYLEAVKKGYSASQNINALCFEPDGLLFSEFEKLFASLFGQSDIYLKLVSEIGKHQEGISREKLLEKINLSTGGRIYGRLDELEEAGFIGHFVPYGKKTDTAYRLIDEFSGFYLSWMKNLTKGILSRANQNYWIKKLDSPSWYGWAGYAFETVCLKHIPQIAKAMKISQIAYDVGSWRLSHRGKENQGAQIDLLFDRADGLISLCEIKLGQKAFVMDKKAALDFERKKEVFLAHFKTKKSLLWTLITPYGVKRNPWSDEILDSEVVLEDLFAF